MAHFALVRAPYICSGNTYVSVVDPPLGPAYLAASLESAGHAVTLIDPVGEAPERRLPAAHPGLFSYGLSIPDIVRKIPASVDGIGVSVMFSQQWPHAEALVRAIHERFPDKPLIIGGEHATATWSYLLRNCPEITACALGEGEETVVELAEWLDGRRDLESIAGLAIRKGGEPVRTTGRRRIRDLEKIPRPAWDLVPLENYFARRNGQGIDRGRSLPVLATRGCPYQCTFCSSPAMWTTKYEVRPVEDIADEIEAYVERYGIVNVDFADLTAFIKRSWILDLCREFERRQFRLTFQLPVGTRSEVLDREVLEALYRAGCRNITYAPESGSQRTLERIKKRVHLDRMMKSVEAAVDVGMVVKVNNIIGFPFEERRDVLETLRSCLKMALIGAEDIQWFQFCPYPGTELYDELRREGALPEMSNAFFASLGTTEWTGGRRLCPSMGQEELSLYLAGGMFLSIATAYASHPSKIARTVWNILRGSQESHVERHLAELLNLPWAKASLATRTTGGAAWHGSGPQVAADRLAKPAPAAGPRRDTGSHRSASAVKA